MRNVRIVVAVLSLSICVFAQEREVAVDQPVEQALVAQVAEQGSVPKLVKFSGALRDEAGKAMSGQTTLTFAVYKSKDDVSPLWTETREVWLDGDGKYTVLLGATKAEGIDAEVFASGEGRYVGVAIDGQAELTRALMVSVPYAMKAADSERLGGFAISDFVLTRAAREKLAAKAAQDGSQQALNETFGAISSTANTTEKIAKFTAVDTIGDSVITESSGNIGIGTATPAEQLEITGNLRMPITTATTGVLFSGPNRLLHVFPSGSGNVFLGVNAGNLTNTSNTNVGIGTGSLALVTSGSFNMAIGGQSLAKVTTGTQNTAIGSQALFNNTSNNNVAIGFNTLVANTTGNGNTGVGTQALQGNGTGTFLTAIGYNADVNSGALTNSTAIGANARVTTSNTVVIGNNANVAIGNSAPSFTAGGGLHIFNPSTATVKLQSSGGVYELFAISNGNFGLFDSVAGAYRMYVAGTTGNVGFGTSGPTVTAGSGINIYNPSTAGLRMQTNGNSYEFLSLGTNNFGLFDVGAAAYRWYVTTNGNMGVGTTTPANKLEVAGTIKSTTGGFVFPDGSTQTTAVQGGNVQAGVGILVANNIVSANFTQAGGDQGSGLAVARGDHTHDSRYVQISPNNFQYTNASINGRYGFSQFGATGGANNTIIVYSGNGSFTTNGAGSITSGSMTQRTSSGLTCTYNLTGTYSVTSTTGTGTATLTGTTSSSGCSGNTTTLAIQVTQEGASLVWSQTDASGWAAGQALKQ